MEMSLKELFNDCVARYNNITELSPRSEDFIERYNETVKVFDQCIHALRQLSLYSSNEDLEDLSTSDMRYISIYFYRGKIAEMNVDRHVAVNDSMQYFATFLKLAEDYGLVPDSLKKFVEAAKNGSSAETADNFIHPKNPEGRRKNKIEQFRAEKEIRERLKALSMRPHADEDVVRETQIAQIALQVANTLTSIESLRLEKGLIDKKVDVVPQTKNSIDETRLDYESIRRGGPRLPHRGPGPTILESTKHGLMRTLDRDIRRGPDPSTLPTMGIDEYLDIERRRGGILDSQPSQKPEHTDEESEDEDEKTMKEREWDEFKESNPKGSGNTMNNG
ncbi:hypothetical protein CANCADRAFT_1692 [Tortispora caseinolytica NRRL Y-17796]|uniref:TAP42-like protein n=1 Tax=Tortispora caseinolytica NRRL Y-17796 TaxID=767744 RepID=A0A1E4TDY3_9ASCO|nr:hypothetical protein CANCADRAFT_1692 [Tortispora caseinolytica NRRL Y-17796]